MRATLAVTVSSFLLLALLAAAPPPKQDSEGLGEQIGQQIDRGVQKLGHELRTGWDQIRRTVDELGVQGRVYGRLHWDKAVNGAPISITVEHEHVVILTGDVPSEIVHQKVLKLTHDTVGVQQVVDKLRVVPPAEKR
ncbi:MAG TPA: BON domain-containing protein [Lacipirellulaceae bacterium]|nr:BON domain-containing protein [Lacipirellulaceae bacterium]